MQTLLTPAFSETEEKKSRFLAYLVPINQFDATLARLQEDHPKAAHHVTASRFFDGDKRLQESAKDDGEPSGTSGVPCLKVLQGNGLVNVGVIVVRYFGGTKLGTGGLVRAYGGAVKAVVAAADLVPFAHQRTLTLTARFDRVSELERLLAAHTIQSRHYGETGVEVTLSGDENTMTTLETQWNAQNY